MSSDIDQAISVALASISHALQTSPEESLAAQADGLAASEKIQEWVVESVETGDGVVLTRDEFRRRLESLRARFAGQAERLRVGDACERLETLVLGGAFSPFAEDIVSLDVFRSDAFELKN